MSHATSHPHEGETDAHPLRTAVPLRSEQTIGEISPIRACVGDALALPG